MLDALKAVLPAVGSKKLSAHFLIRGRTVTAFNGEQVLTASIACDLEFAPKAKAFVRAVKKCKSETIALWVNPEGNIMIHAGEVTETVECAPMEKFPAEIQTGFWFNEPRAKKAPKPKCVPPDPVWLRPDYLPGLEEARRFNVPLMTIEELVAACNARHPLICDVEIFKNYFLVCFTSVKTGKVVYFEMREGEALDVERLKWILEHFLIVTFNGDGFDLPLLSLALAGRNCAQLKSAADAIIGGGERMPVKPWQVLKSAKVKRLKIDAIDIQEVCPLSAFVSLKLFAGRLHAPKMQDLPFPHDAVLSEDQISIVRFYCVNDLTATAFCFVNLREQLEIRQSMTERYGMDLRSKSDAQIAEAVINGELQRLTFAEPERPHVEPGTRYRYKKPDFIRFQTPMMNRTLQTILGWEFYVEESGAVCLPIDPETQKSVALSVTIAGGTYTIGIGGLHSNETTVCHKADAETLIVDRDVTSYYPSIILNLELYPLHLGPAFLQVYRSIVQRRVEAKKAAKHAGEQAKECDKAGDVEGARKWREVEKQKKAEAETLKIVVNGSFGKLGSKWSTLYAPDLLMTVTITGQLSLLMLIERLELRGIQVCSANTDGIVIKCPKARAEELNNIIAGWEKETGFATEETRYSAVYSRDVNNYIAVKLDGKTKTKGAYFNPWCSDEYKYERFKKNPSGAIAIDAVTEFLTKGTPISQTIRSANDVRKFVSIRTVKGGACKDGVYLGKAVRWYYAAGETGCILYAQSGKKVAESDGARPCMELPKVLPADLDFAYYENEAAKILAEIGAV